MQLDFFYEHEDLVTDENGKVCSKCNKYLPLSAFSPCSGGNYLRAECKSCNTKMAKIRKRLKEEYKETDKVKFRVGARKRYIQKTFSTSVQEATQSFVPEACGSYAIRDVATGENIIPFSDFTKLSCDVSGSFFTQWLNTFEPNRVYKIMLKLKTDDKNEQIFDEDFEFKVKR